MEGDDSVTESKRLGQKKRSNLKNRPTKEDKYIIDQELESFQTYREVIGDIIESRKYQSGEGIRKYKQPKRNAYKIQGDQYGGLMIDIPKLMNEMKLDGYRGGKLVYQADADKSPINLLTKRFNPKNKYSMDAVKIFNDLNTLSNLPSHKSSGKSRMVGSSIMYYQDPKQLADRMKILIGSMAAGNNSPVLKNDLSQINDELLKIEAIDKTMHEKLYKKYIK